MQDAILHLNLPTSEAAAAPGVAHSSFIVGPENRLLAPVIQRFVDGEDLVAAAVLFNPLVLVGPAGSGKSHLVQGLVRHWRRRLADDHVAYFTAADLAREYQSAHVEERLPKWRSSLRGLKLLVVEGLERLRRGAAVGRELRQVIDAVIDRGGMVVVTADREPASLANLELALRDRLAAGLALRLANPGLDARRALLTQAAHWAGMTLTTDQLEQIARPESDSAAQVIERINHPIDGNEETHAAPLLVDADEHDALKHILAVASRYFGVTRAALVSPSRRKSLVAARNTVVYLARRLTSLSYGEIGRGLGGRDHTTIMHAQTRMADAMTHDPQSQLAVEKLERILRA
jgi:chromosomal replication initiator protein